MAAQPSPETPTGQLRKHLPGGYLHPVNQVHLDEATFGERMADKVAGAIGTWRFLIGQGVVIVLWIVANILLLLNHGWDPYPFILLNLALSLQATYAGPIVLLAGNRQSAKDRATLEHAATEADKGGEAINQSLQEIRKNTKLTLDILESLENGA